MHEAFESYRPLMFSIAYRMLGSAMDAEDIIQETYLRYQATPPESIRSLKNFLSTIVTRLSLNQLKSARHQRETYIGPWLPEPVITSGGEGWGRLSDHDSISMAFLVLLESLTPVERAVFLLREVFDYSYAEIVEIVDRSEVACRQLFSRAKKHIADSRPRFESTPEEHKQILNSFVAAVAEGEMEALMSLLAEDVTFWADGGGKVFGAATRPVRGREAVALFLANVVRLAPTDFTVELAEVNGKLGLILRRPNDDPFTVITIEADGGLVHGIHAIANPSKLGRLGGNA